MAEKREAFVGWMSKRDSRVADDGDTICPIEAYEGYAYSVPALVIPFDGDPPPMWPVGTKVRCDAKVRTIDSHPVLHDGSWWFVAKEDGKLYLCCHFEPVPTTASVTLKVTGSPEDIERMRCGLRGQGEREPNYSVVVKDETRGLYVEVLSDA